MSTYPPPTHSLDPALVTSALEIPGHRIVGNIGAGLQTLVGGDITLFTELCEKTRQDSYAMMSLHAAQLGANAVIAFRYDANELMNGVTEVLAYGTAVIVEPVKD